MGKNTNVLKSNGYNSSNKFQTRGLSTSNDVGSAIINTASNCTTTFIRLYGERFSSSVAFNWVCIGY